MEKDNEKLTDSPLPPKKKKLARWARALIDIAVASLAIACVCVIANVGYLNVEFNSPFFVNGMSMYPTLNRDGERLVNGRYRPLTWDDRSNLPGDIVDFGYCKTGDKGNWRASLTRWDIVVSYYASDYDASGQLLPGAEQKIKRLIAMPGETITFETVHRESDPDGVGGFETVGEGPRVRVENFSADYNPAWGKTTIVSTNGEETVLRPLYSNADFSDIGTYRYPDAGFRNGKKAMTWTLGADEYFLMGDNRGSFLYSDDSREHGPVSADMLMGKAYLITGKRQIVRGSDGALNAPFRLTMARMPWDYLHLDWH